VHTIKSERHPGGSVELAGNGQERIQQLQTLLLDNDKSCVRIIGDIVDDK
jgi:hypothetical protein